MPRAGLTWGGNLRLSRLPQLPLTPIIICVAALAITYLGFSTTRYAFHNYQLHRDEVQLRTDIAQLDTDHERLTSVRDYLRSDEYIEDVARRTLGLVRPGETLVVVSSSAPPAAATATSAAIVPASEWWKSLFVQPALTPTPR